VIILRIMIYKVVQFGWGADLKNFKDTWIHCSSKVHKDI
jgi:hypothetical protein